MFSRRQFLAAALAGLTTLERIGRAADDERRMLMPAEETIETGLAYLAGNQAQDGPLAGSFGEGRARGNVALTSLAALAFMSGGHQPGRGKYGPAVERALQYVLSQAGADGFLNNAEAALRGPMYNHGFGTLFLAEVDGTVHDPNLAASLKAKLKQAVRLILSTQNEEGGWRYEPVAADQADLSVTVTQAMALRAARNIGIDVPKATIERCSAYIKSCQVLPEGGFRYMPQIGPTAFPRSAAALAGLHCCGLYEGTEIDSARKYLKGFLASKQSRAKIDQYFLYGHYYAALAMRQAGGKDWLDWYAAIRDELCQPEPGVRPKEPAFLNRYQETRSWTDAHYVTALACIILQMPKRCLPIFQN